MKNLLIFLLFVVLVSCNKENSNKTEQAEEKKNGAETSDKSKKIENRVTPDSVKAILGYYVGEFIAEEFNEESPYTYSNKITISIDLISNDSLYGHSVVAGNNRPFKGSFEYKNNSYAAKVSEPGDDKYD
jgi:hypothetical protein